MDNFDNNNMGGFEPQKPFTEKPVQNNNMNTEQTIPVSEPETREEQAQNVQPQNGNTPYGDYIFGNNNQNTANNANPTENVPPYQQNQNPNPNTYAQPWQYGYGQYPYSGQNPQYNQNNQRNTCYNNVQIANHRLPGKLLFHLNCLLLFFKAMAADDLQNPHSFRQPPSLVFKSISYSVQLQIILHP